MTHVGNDRAFPGSIFADKAKPIDARESAVAVAVANVGVRSLDEDDDWDCAVATSVERMALRMPTATRRLVIVSNDSALP